MTTTQDVFKTHCALARLFPAITFKAAAAEARALGVMIRRESDWGQLCRGWEVYPVGQPDRAGWAASPAEALYLARCWDADLRANRLSLFCCITIKARAEVIAEAAADAAGIDRAAMVAAVLPIEVGADRVGVRFTGADVTRTEARIDPKDPDDMAGRLAAAAEATADDVASLARSAEAAGAVCDATGPDWEPTAATARFAQLPDGGRFAFGRSDSVALAQLGRALWESQWLDMGKPEEPAALCSCGRAAPCFVCLPLDPDGTRNAAEAARRAPRSLSAAATPADLLAGYDVPQRAASAADGAQRRASGAFPFRAVARAQRRAADRVALAIDEALELGLFGDDDPEELDRLAYGPAWLGLV